ncbi:UPF0052 domain protein [Xylaria palmicola]|nr:UPF0052 domain protein [Xylaria palmicola]
MDTTTTPRPARGIVVFGGGTATNSLVDVFERLRAGRSCTLQYVIPISDNGGSSSELIRVLGGPGIGDIRSRLVRLIPDTDAESASLKSLFNHRLSPDASAARAAWLDIVEGRHALWAHVSSEKRELIRSIFNHTNMEIVKRARPSSVFNFAKASVGNLFLTGARLFTGSLESAIYLLSTICAVPSTVATLPAINSNFTHHISAGLEDGSQITGQNAISHPSAPTSLPDSPESGAAPAESASLPFIPIPAPGLGAPSGGPAAIISPHHPLPRAPSAREDPQTVRRETEAHDRIEDATLPGSLPSLRKPYLNFTKSPSSSSSPATAGADAADNNNNNNDLAGRIARIWYINPYGHEIYPLANPKVLAAIERAGTVVYSIGSLYTSIVPSLVLRGVGRAIAAAAPRARQKILILNSSLDRETGPARNALTATDFVRAVARACAQSEGFETRAAAGHAEQPAAGSGDVQDHDHDHDDAASVRRYVTHLLYLEGEGAPRVDRAELAALGVDCIRVYGRRVDDMLQYDEAGLVGALEAIVGKPEMVRSRRNTSGQ